MPSSGDGVLERPRTTQTVGQAGSRLVRNEWRMRAGQARPLALLGRWSLSFYMVHQPVLICVLMAYVALIR